MTTRSTSDPPSSAAEKRALLKRLLRERIMKQARRTVSFGQQRLWIVDRLVPDSPGYNTDRVIRMEGELNTEALERALNEVIRRHDVCRANFSWEEGRVVQIVRPSFELALERVDLGDVAPQERQTALEEVALDKTLAPFDLGQDPLWRATLIRLGAREHVLVLVIHHIATDAWSWGVIHRELSALYAAFASSQPSPLEAPALQYSDFATWQRRLLEGEAAQRQLQYWREALAGAPAILELPADRRRPAVPSYLGGSKSFRLEDDLVRGLRELGNGLGASFFMTLLAAFDVLLWRYSSQADLVVGCPVASRSRSEFEDMVGLFINVLPVRTRLQEGLSFNELVGQVRHAALGAFGNQDLPFDVLVSELSPERALDHHPIFQVMFAVQQPLLQNLDLPGIVCTPLELETRPLAYDLTLVAIEEPEGETIQIDYSRDLFDPTRIERMASHFEVLLRGILADPEQPIADLPLLSAGERQCLVEEWNRTRVEYPRDALVHELFEDQAARTPDAIAASYDGRTLTYRELDERSNQLAHSLRSLGVAPDDLVGICLQRSFEMLVAMLGILKAGGAYLPLDPDYPRARLAFMLEDAEVEILLTQERLRGNLPETAAHVIFVDSQWPEIASSSREPLARRGGPDHLAYVIYTSGSTGIPKGVEVPHRAINRLVCNTDYVDLGPEDRIAQASVASFDAATFEIWGPLLNGARVVGVPRDVLLNPRAFAQCLVDEKITVLFLTTALFNQMAREAPGAFGSLRYLLFGGQAVDPGAVRAVLEQQPPHHLLHVYGPTETTTFATWHLVGKVEEQETTVPIGRPIANSEAYVLDSRMRPVPVGVPGELYLGGDGVARGYLKRPELTAERFVPDPFAASEGRRLYRTGDFVRLREDGAIEFLGRRDDQVKLRGFRIELGEVEAALSSLESVRHSAVIVREDEPGKKRLVAYVVPATSHGRDLTWEELRRELRDHLPDYMIPSAFVELASLPLNVNGKVDREALPAPTGERALDESLAPPRGEVEEKVAAIFRDVLEVQEVGIRDNFFDLGGHSLLLVEVHSRLKREFDQELSVVDLFEYPTVEALAKRLAEGEDRTPALTQIRERARKRREETAAHQPIAIIAMTGRFPGAPNPEALWKNLCEGVESVTAFSDEEILAAGVSPALLQNPDYVKAGVVLEDIDLFDASFFGYSPREAATIDPQQRMLMECAWELLERAGYDPERYGGSIGVYAAVGQNRYQTLFAQSETAASLSDLEILIASDKDFLPTRISYKLDLTGPSVAVQTACSSSLVAVHMAARSLQDFECDMALAGGVSIQLPQKRGHLYQPEGIASPDGHCRAFDVRAEGCVRGSGAGLVLLKRLDDALADGDTIHAVIVGSAINNDGATKVGFTAPSVEGQAAVITAAQAQMEIDPRTISYVEAHGTGTHLGDLVEVAALTQAFRVATDEKGFCALGSIKTNMGHLDAAAGVTGLIKATLALEHGSIPPSLHFESPNPEIDLESSPFYVNTDLRPWPSPIGPRRAGVSSFGMGGTNAHVVLEEPPPIQAAPVARDWQLFPLSARTEAALEATSRNLAGYLQTNPEVDPANVAYTLQVGRRAFENRRVVLGRDLDEAVEALEGGKSRRVWSSRAPSKSGATVFMFSGQGSQYPGMGRGLFERAPVFREILEECCQRLKEASGIDILPAMYPSEADVAAARERLNATEITQPALFAIEYSLARQWMHWGIRPSAMIGHSIGEYVAACLAGVFSVEDALRLSATRGRLMGDLELGTMIAVRLPEGELRELLEEDVSVAAVNAAELCVASGPTPAIERLESRLAEHDVHASRLHTSHAFHSSMMEPAVKPLVEAFQGVRLAAPRVPYLSNVTGTWIDARQATDPEYWGRHLLSPVRFADGIGVLLEGESGGLLEIGPGRTLATLARRNMRPDIRRWIVTSIRSHEEDDNDLALALESLGKLWLAGAPVEWERLHGEAHRRRACLPSYPFQRQRHWVEPEHAGADTAVEQARVHSDRADWFYVPSWQRSLVPRPPADSEVQSGSWLIFCDDLGIGERLAARLADLGARVARARAGAGFAQIGPGEYQLAPGEGDGYQALFSALQDAEGVPSRILHLWGVTGEADSDPASATHFHQDRGFYSLLFLAQALGDLGAKAPIRIEVITNGLQEVGDEDVLCPEKAPLLGPCRVIPDEYANIACRNVDVRIPARDFEVDALVDRLLAETCGPAQDAIVAYRGTQRWRQAFESVRLETAAPAPLREGGVYWITGGLGGVGLALAGHLARSARAKLILTGRSAFPARDDWETWRAAHGDEDPVSSKIERLEEFERQGAEVMIATADVSDETRMHAVFDAVQERFGVLHGVIHAAGVAGGGVMQLKTREMASAVIAPKLDGTRVLHRLLSGCDLDFFLLCSSLVSVLGGGGRVDYCAANAYLDAFATSARRQLRAPTVSVNWDTWREAGMAVDARVPAHLARQRDEALSLGLSDEEGADIFDRVLSRGSLGQVLVSKRDLEVRRAARALSQRVEERAPIVEPSLPVEGAEQARAGDLGPYVAPRDEIETRLCALWQELLGIETVGIHDNFFDLGGHSLLGTQLLSRVRDLFGTELTLRRLLDRPTVADLAEAIEEHDDAREEAGPALVRVARIPQRKPGSKATEGS